MKKLISIALLSIALSGWALAEETQHCYGIGVYTTDSDHNRTYDTTICEFSDGRANVTYFANGDYSSTWYTPEEWAKAKPALIASANAEVAAQDEAAKKAIHEMNVQFQRDMARLEMEGLVRRAFESKKSCEKKAKKEFETHTAMSINEPAAGDVQAKTFYFTTAWDGQECKAVMLN